jgi:hypothetical protein
MPTLGCEIARVVFRRDFLFVGGTQRWADDLRQGTGMKKACTVRFTLRLGTSRSKRLLYMSSPLWGRLGATVKDFGNFALQVRFLRLHNN